MRPYNICLLIDMDTKTSNVETLAISSHVPANILN